MPASRLVPHASVFLVGLPGSGRATVARAAARVLGVAALDARARSLGDFRGALVQGRVPRIVVAGARAVRDDACRSLMRKRGAVVWLDVGTEQLLAREQGCKQEYEQEYEQEFKQEFKQGCKQGSKQGSKREEGLEGCMLPLALEAHAPREAALRRARWVLEPAFLAAADVALCDASVDLAVGAVCALLPVPRPGLTSGFLL